MAHADAGAGALRPGWDLVIFDCGGGHCAPDHDENLLAAGADGVYANAAALKAALG